MLCLPEPYFLFTFTQDTLLLVVLRLALRGGISLNSSAAPIDGSDAVTVLVCTQSRAELNASLGRQPSLRFASGKNDAQSSDC